MYIANLTRQIQVLNYWLPEVRLPVHITVNPGDQSEIPEATNHELVAYIAKQFEVYKIYSVSEALSRNIPIEQVGMVWSEKEISMTQVYDLIHGRGDARDIKAAADIATALQSTGGTAQNHEVTITAMPVKAKDGSNLEGLDYSSKEKREVKLNLSKHGR
jgi:hypothetical protein